MLNVCKEIFDEIEKEHIIYCHWKSNEHLEDGLNGLTDLDLLVSKKNRQHFEKILLDKQCLKMIPQRESKYPMVDEWLGFDENTGKLIHLHVHYKIITGTAHLKEYILPWEDLALNTRIKDSNTNVYIIEPQLELFILYIRIVLKEPRKIELLDYFVLDNAYQREIKWLKDRIDIKELDKLGKTLFFHDYLDIVPVLEKQRATKEDFAKLQKTVCSYLDNFKRKGIMNSKSMSFLLEKYAVLKKLLVRFSIIYPIPLKKTLKKRGVSIAFIGSDGSGKSKLSQEICLWLNWKLDCQNIYFGMGERYKKPLIYKLYMSSLLKEEIRDICGTIFYTWISIRCLFLNKIGRNYIKLGGILVCDRYPQTQFKGIYDGPKVESLFNNSNLFKKKCSSWEIENLKKVEEDAPDIIFKLVVPPELAIKRSPEHSISEIRKKANITGKILFDHSTVYVIDTTQNYKREVLEVKKLIWQEIVKKSKL